MISIEGVTKKFGSYTAVEDVNCTIANGSIYGLIGYNGAGKTTLLKTIAGIYKADGGQVLVDETPVYENQSLKQQFFIMTEELYFLPQATLETMRWFYSGYYPSWSDQTFFGLLPILGLNSQAKISGFSKGMQRQAGLLLALSTHPRYLLLDEAFDGLDLAKRNLMTKLLRYYVKAKQGIAVISSHNLRELEGIVDNLGMIKDQRLFFNSSVAEMQKAKIKYGFSCPKPLDAVQLRGFGLGQLQQDGGRYTCIVDSEDSQVLAVITACGAKEIQKLPISLEEFFLNEKEEPDFYDWQALF